MIDPIPELKNTTFFPFDFLNNGRNALVTRAGPRTLTSKVSEHLVRSSLIAGIVKQDCAWRCRGRWGLGSLFRDLEGAGVDGSVVDQEVDVVHLVADIRRSSLYQSAVSQAQDRNLFLCTTYINTLLVHTIHLDHEHILRLCCDLVDRISRIADDGEHSVVLAGAELLDELETESAAGTGDCI